jgi:hypothetical protein
MRAWASDADAGQVFRDWAYACPPCVNEADQLGLDGPDAPSTARVTEFEATALTVAVGGNHDQLLCSEASCVLEGPAEGKAL